jgi:hypothetical protein
MASSDDLLLDFNENTVGPRPLVEEKIRAIPAINTPSITSTLRFERRWRPRWGARD